MQNKYMSMLGLARRAGRLSMGHDTVLDSIKKNKSELIIFSCDISQRLIDEISAASERYMKALPCVKISESMEEIHIALGYKAGVISVNDTNFANRLLELINQEGNEYGD